MNRITLHTEITINSAHYLNLYSGPCFDIHGHTWKLKIWIQGNDDQKDDIGILYDFSNIKKIKEVFDHKLINEKVDYFKSINPTAENISLYIIKQLKEVYPNLEFRIRLYESAVDKKTYAQRQTINFDFSLL